MNFLKQMLNPTFRFNSDTFDNNPLTFERLVYKNEGKNCLNLYGEQSLNSSYEEMCMFY